MPVSSLILFLVFIVLVISLFKKNADVFSPARLFLIVWTFSLGLVQLKLSHFQQQWSLYSWLIIMVSLFSVLLGMLIIYVLNFEKRIFSINSMRTVIINFQVKPQILFNLILILFFAYVLSYLIIYLIVGFVPLFTARPDLMRSRWNVFGAGLIIHSVPAIIYFIILYFIKVKKSLKHKIILSIIMVTSFVSYLLLLQRFDLVIFIVLSAMFLYYGTNKIKMSSVILIVIGFVVIMYGISSIRTSNLIVEYLYYGGKMKFSKDFAIFTEPYMYVSMNIENFAYAVNRHIDYTYGYYTFDFILALSGLKHWLFEYNQIDTFPNLITEGYNTYTMFFAYYRDFGVLGSFFFSTLFGAVTYLTYLQMKEFPTINSISLYGVLTVAVIFSFFIPILSWLHFVFNLSVIFLFSKIITIKGH